MLTSTSQAPQNTGVPTEGLDTNLQAIPDESGSDNLQTLPDTGLTDNTQALEDDKLADNLQPIHVEARQDKPQNVANNGLKDNTQALDKEAVKDRTLAVNSEALEDNNQALTDEGLDDNQQALPDDELDDNRQAFLINSFAENLALPKTPCLMKTHPFLSKAWTREVTRRKNPKCKTMWWRCRIRINRSGPVPHLFLAAPMVLRNRQLLPKPDTQALAMQLQLRIQGQLHKPIPTKPSKPNALKHFTAGFKPFANPSAASTTCWMIYRTSPDTGLMCLLR